jgi:hypothetical protein
MTQESFVLPSFIKSLAGGVVFGFGLAPGFLRVEVTRVARAVEKATLLELALHLDEAVSDTPQQGYRYGLVVDEGARAPVTGERSPQEQQA